MRFHIAICDDEKIISQDIYNKIIDVKSSCNIDIYNSSSELLENHSQYDIIFLDIEMPDVNGIDVSYFLREKGYKGAIVFLTSHIEFVQEAFKVKAFRYLSKPVDSNELKETIDDVEKEVLDNAQIIVKDYGSEYTINPSDIYYIKSDRNKTIIRLKDKALDVKKTLKQWLYELGETRFYHVHKSYVVAFRYIERIETDVIVLVDLDEEIPMSRRNRTEFKEAYHAYIKEKARLT